MQTSIRLETVSTIMSPGEFADQDKTAVVGQIGKTTAQFALTDRVGNFRQDSVRTYQAADHKTVSGALLTFQKESGLPSLPSRCALAVAGVPRGDTISITHSPWFISKSGLAAMLKRMPTVLNDFAANVWAVSATSQQNLQAVAASIPTGGAGTFLVVGMGAGLGVAAFNRSEDGTVTVTATEAGHSELLDDSPALAPFLQEMRREARASHAEVLLSSRGLVALRNAVAAAAGATTRVSSAEEVMRGASQGDSHARTAVELFTKALWRFVGNLTLIHGAWDGVFLTGQMVNALRPALRNPENSKRYIIEGPYAALLRAVPAAFLTLEHSELRGAAEAIRSHN